MKVSDMDLTENNVLNRIQDLLEFKHWSLYRLSRESGLAYSSLHNIFRRNTCPSIPTLEKICDGLGISLSQFFEYEEKPLKIDTLTDEEQDIINYYRALSRENKGLLRAYLRGLCKK